MTTQVLLSTLNFCGKNCKGQVLGFVLVSVRINSARECWTCVADTVVLIHLLAWELRSKDLERSES